MAEPAAAAASHKMQPVSRAVLDSDLNRLITNAHRRYHPDFAAAVAVLCRSISTRLHGQGWSQLCLQDTREHLVPTSFQHALLDAITTVSVDIDQGKTKSAEWPLIEQQLNSLITLGHSEWQRVQALSSDLHRQSSRSRAAHIELRPSMTNGGRLMAACSEINVAFERIYPNQAHTPLGYAAARLALEAARRVQDEAAVEHLASTHAAGPASHSYLARILLFLWEAAIAIDERRATPESLDRAHQQVSALIASLSKFEPQSRRLAGRVSSVRRSM
ncbi:hypothetical protein JCM10207_006928 [Rhodosporidiobolus poonsookiae]